MPRSTKIIYYDLLGKALIARHGENLNNPNAIAKVKRSLNSVVLDRVLDNVLKSRKSDNQVGDVLVNIIIKDRQKDDIIVEALSNDRARLNIIVPTVPAEESIIRSYKRGMKIGRFVHNVDVYKNNKESAEATFQLMAKYAGMRNIGLEIMNNDVPLGEIPKPIVYVDMKNSEIQIFDLKQFKEYFKKTFIKVVNHESGEISELADYLSKNKDSLSSNDLANLRSNGDIIYPSEVVKNPNIVEEQFLKVLDNLSKKYTINILSPNRQSDDSSKVIASLENSELTKFGSGKMFDALKTRCDQNILSSLECKFFDIKVGHHKSVKVNNMISMR